MYNVGMKTIILKNINTNLDVLKEITIKDNHTEIWTLNQLISKYQMLLHYLEKEIVDDIEKFHSIVDEVQEEANYFITKYNM